MLLLFGGEAASGRQCASEQIAEQLRHRLGESCEISSMKSARLELLKDYTACIFIRKYHSPLSNSETLSLVGRRPMGS